MVMVLVLMNGTIPSQEAIVQLMRPRSATSLDRRLPSSWSTALPEGRDPGTLLIAVLLNRLGRRFEVALDDLLRDHGLIASESRVLGTLLLQGPPHELSPTRLNELVLLSSGGITKAVSRLADLGYVERRADPGDGRGVLVRLTAAGEAVGSSVLGDVVAAVDGRLAGFDVNRRAAIVAVLEDLLGAYGDRVLPPTAGT
jgi:DNA-binding MarR family transcriptional regulator